MRMSSKELVNKRWEPERTPQPAETYLHSAELCKEQNYNMVGDGLLNNIAPAKADLTDGQTHEEIRELAPETLLVEIQPGSENKPSLLGQVLQHQSEHPEPDAEKLDAQDVRER